MQLKETEKIETFIKEGRSSYFIKNMFLFWQNFITD